MSHRQNAPFLVPVLRPFYNIMSAFFLFAWSSEAFTLLPPSILTRNTGRIAEHQQDLLRHPAAKMWKSIHDLQALDQDEEDSDEASTVLQNALLDKANQLRQEAKELEDNLNSAAATTPSATNRRRRMRGGDTEHPDSAPTTYTDMKDSTWTFTYRFSNEPEPKEDKKESDTSATTIIRRTFYSGKVTFTFRSDGFTDFVSHDPSATAGSSNNHIDFVKVWGWDLEQSNENDKDNAEYVLFSADVSVPPVADVTNDDAAQKSSTSTSRFYFQARQDRDTQSKIISLNEGTVTIKQDVVDSRAGMWALFSPAGILAEFRYVGDFVAKPSAVRS